MPPIFQKLIKPRISKFKHVLILIENRISSIYRQNNSSHYFDKMLFGSIEHMKYTTILNYILHNILHVHFIFQFNLETIFYSSLAM